MIFGSVTGTIPPGPTSTGCTDPIVVPGAIAARSVDTSRIVPALHACAPTGPTHPRIGTSRALLNISAIATVSASPPVSSSLLLVPFPRERGRQGCDLARDVPRRRGIRDDDHVLLPRDLREGLQLPQPHRGRRGAVEHRGFPHLLGGLEFTFGHD